MTKARFILLAGLLLLVGVSGLAGCRSAHTTSAILYIDEQNYDKAVQVIHEGFQYRDDEPDAYYYLGEAYSYLAEEAVEGNDFLEAKNNYVAAYEAYRKAESLNSEDYSEKVEEALLHNYNNRVRQASLDWDEDIYFEQAEGHMRLAYAALPDSMSPIKNIARMKMQMSQDARYMEQEEELLTEAMVLLDQVLAKNPEAYDLQLNKANVLAALGRNDEAKQIFDTLLAEHGEDTGLLIDIANLAIDDQDYGRAADFYVQVVDLNEADTDDNDADNQAMLVAAGTWYGSGNIGRYEDAIVVLDRAADLEQFPTENTMLMRLRTYYNYGKNLKERADAEADPLAKTELANQADAMFSRAVEIGLAMTSNFPGSSDGFMFLSMAQLEMGDFAASEANFKTSQELQSP